MIKPGTLRKQTVQAFVNEDTQHVEGQAHAYDPAYGQGKDSPRDR